MIGRMSSLQFNQLGISNILDAQEQVARLQEKIANGKRLTSPSDDPVASAKIITLQTELAKIESYQRSIASATTALSIEETALRNANEILLRVRELSVLGQNGVLAASDRQIIGTEIEGLRKQLINIANTRNAEGEFIFSGSASLTRAYDENGVFQGDDVVREINISANSTVPIGHSAEEVFEAINTENPIAIKNTFDVIDAVSNALKQGEWTDLEQSQVSKGLRDIDIAIEKLSSARTGVGTRMNWISNQATLNAEFNLDLKKTLSELEDLDLADAVGRLQMQMVSLQAAQQTFVKTQNLSLFNYL